MKRTVTILTDASGDATDYSVPLTGYLEEVIGTIGTHTAGAVDYVVTGAQTGAALITITNMAASTTYRPRAPTVSSAAGGTALTFDGTEPVSDRYYLDGEAIKIVTSDGGNAKTGYLTFVLS
jgi:hypothetical protein